MFLSAKSHLPKFKKLLVVHFWHKDLHLLIFISDCLDPFRQKFKSLFLAWFIYLSMHLSRLCVCLALWNFLLSFLDY